ncbi:MAG: amino acid-binding protein [Bacteroidaceae bacterium]|nr:amino acid-binding protein [Bacteroidaceae bacterium]
MENTLKQLSIFIENKSGTLIKVLELFSKAKIQIIASTIADTQDYGIFRVLCSSPCLAYTILKEHGINVQLTDVLAIAIEDEPGHAALAISALSEAGVNILYMYSFLWQGRGVLVMRTDESDKAMEVIEKREMVLLGEDDFKI